MKVNKLHPLFAAELTGADAARPDAELVEAVEDAMREYAVLCIRGQGHIDDEQHLAFARAFGPLELPGTKPLKGGRVAFGLPLFSHLPGFFVMTIATAGAAAALGLVLATVARTRAQLSGFSTILILTMSALGGSMFPRFLMTDTMQRMGLVTFNAWALDGYLKVFWRDAALWELWPQVLVLVSLGVAFMLLARLLARRWEMA